MSDGRKKKPVVPRLRFPEFRDAGAWEVKQLGEVFHERRERGGSDLELLAVTMSDGVVRASDLDRKNNASADLSNYKTVHPGDIAYNSMRMWQGASGVSFWHGIVSPAYTVVTPAENQNAVFWAYHFKLSHTIEKFACFSQGVTSDTWNLKYPAFSTIRLAFPTDPSEQQKIADCLSSLDELIELQAQKVEALRQHKKGLMQQLFPREGETTPRLRFPEFRDAGAWKVKYGNSLFIPISNKEHDGSLPVLAITQENGAIPRHLIDYHVSVTEKSLKSYKVVEIGDFIISLRTFQGGIEYSDYKGICSPAYIVLRKATNEVVNNFFRHYFKTKKYIADLNRNLEGLRDGKMVSYKQFSEIKLPLPSPPEQQKIADCLSSLDELIELQAQKVEALRQHKKGLMQQLFPQEVA